MKHLLATIILSMATAAFAVGHPNHDQPDHPDHPTQGQPDHPDHPEGGDHPDHPKGGDHPDHPDHPANDGDAKESSAADDAKTLLKKVHDTYKKAAVLSEVITISLPAMMPGADAEEMKIKVAIGKDSGKIVAEGQMTAVYADGVVNLVIDEIDGGYVSQKADSFYEGLDAASGGQGLPGLWTLAFRDSDSMDTWLSSLSLGMPGAEISAVNTADNGSSTIDLKTMMGMVVIGVTPENTIDNIVMTISQPGMPSMEIKATSEIAILDKMPKVTFDAGTRKKFASMDELIDSMDEDTSAGGDEDTSAGGDEDTSAGGAAPDFTLARMNGTGDVTLSDLKGSVVVLDFWATWCGPCKRGLPFLNEFHDWAQAEGVDVKIFAVNVWEEGKEETVKKFWADNKYKVQVLMGSADKKLTDSYKINGIPTTVIIGTDGSIFDQHSGFRGGKEMVDGLKKKVAEAIAASSK